MHARVPRPGASSLCKPSTPSVPSAGKLELIYEMQRLNEALYLCDKRFELTDDPVAQEMVCWPCCCVLGQLVAMAVQCHLLKQLQ